jgi:cell division protein FtsW
VFITLILILPANFSTGIDFCNDTYVRVYWEISIKYIETIVGSGILFLFFLFLLPKLFLIPGFSRVTTWESRIENFSTDKPDEDDYQIERLKLLLHLENLWLVLGKVFRRTFYQSSSDFIYAIIVEEYGLIGGFGVLILYLLLSVSIYSSQSQYAFGKLVVVGLGFPMIFKRW